MESTLFTVVEIARARGIGAQKHKVLHAIELCGIQPIRMAGNCRLFSAGQRQQIEAELDRIVFVKKGHGTTIGAQT